MLNDKDSSFSISGFNNSIYSTPLFLSFFFSLFKFCFKSPQGAQRLAGNGFSIGGSGLLEPLGCLVRGREDPLKAKAFSPLFGYSREVGHSPGTGYEYGY
jgi:hypothetical protein